MQFERDSALQSKQQTRSNISFTRFQEGRTAFWANIQTEDYRDDCGVYSMINKGISFLLSHPSLFYWSRASRYFSFKLDFFQTTICLLFFFFKLIYTPFFVEQAIKLIFEDARTLHTRGNPGGGGQCLRVLCQRYAPLQVPPHL